MPPLPELVELTPENFESLACCGVKDPAHAGRRLKNCWLAAQFRKGLRARVLIAPDRRQCGYIEYLPGEHAWRGVDAPGYMFVHCIWTFYRQYQRQGAARTMLDACLEDARRAGMHGVAAIAREKPWLAGSALFLANGFEQVDAAPPDYRLLVKKLDPSAPSPAFRGDGEQRLQRYAEGFTVIRSSQCPHAVKFADEIISAARDDYGLDPRVVEIRTARQAQAAPTPYAGFALIRDGKLLADHPISLTRFRNIMRKMRP
jgi:hypothetical protein